LEKENAFSKKKAKTKKKKKVMKPVMKPTPLPRIALQPNVK
jgi:hypothetical protein